MYRFISNAGIVAYNVLNNVFTVNASRYVVAANICKAGIANALPMIVCGRVNLHNTDMKDFLLFVVVVVVVVVPSVVFVSVFVASVSKLVVKSVDGVSTSTLVVTFIDDEDEEDTDSERIVLRPRRSQRDTGVE